MSIVEDFISHAKSLRVFSFDIEHDPEKSLHQAGFDLWGCSFSTDTHTFYAKNKETVLRITGELFPIKEIEAVAYNGKYDIQCLVQAGWALSYPETVVDPMIGLNLLDDNKRPNQLGLKENIFEIFGHRMMTFEQAFAYGPDSPQFTQYACEDSLWEFRLWQRIKPELEHQKLLKYFQYIPALKFFADVETCGVKWDLDNARKLMRDYLAVADELEEDIYKEIGVLNLDSPKQVRERLFTDLGYATHGLRKTDSGEISTDADAMEILAHRYPICSKIVKYRTATKMNGTYVVPLSQYAIESADQRIHPKYWLVSATGRTRCDQPNLQNIPAHLAKDFKHLDIRQMFIPRDGYKFVVFDLSQIELRLVAHFSKDPMFLKAYRDWECTACRARGSDTKILHACPKCGIGENEGILKDKSIQGFWHGLDLHTITAEKVGALHGNRQAGKCVHQNTLVSINNKLTRVGSLHSGREAGKFYDLSGQVAAGSHINTVDSFYCDGVKDQYLVVTKKGILVCSATHGLGTNVGWVEAQNLQKHHIVDSCDVPMLPEEGFRTISFNPFFQPHTYPNAKGMCKLELNEEWAYVAGVFIGDGTFKSEDQIGFTGGGTKKEDIAWKQTLINTLEGVGLHVTSISTTKERSAYNLNIGCRRIGNFFKDELGLYPKKGHEITIPSWVWESRRTAMAFIGGLFDTDGYIGKSSSKKSNELSICTKSWQLAADLMVLLKACGYGSRSRITVSYNKTYKKDYYLVNINKDCLCEICNMGYVRHTFKSCRIRLEPPYQLTRPVDNNVIKVTKIGQSCLVDLAIKEDRHNYTANGLNSHNTANFALVYCATATRMNSEAPEFSVEEWQDVIDDYFDVYSGVRYWHKYMEGVLQSRHETRDIFGRLRRIPPFMIKQSFKHALNQIVNFPPQSSACGMMQLACSKIRRVLMERGDWLREVFPLNMVHDEIDMEIREDKLNEAVPLIRDCFEHIVQLEVPVRVGIGIGDNWKDAK